MALSHQPISQVEAFSPRRGLGVLFDPAVSTGTDFTLTAWQGEKIAVHVSASATAAFFEATGGALTTNTVTDAANAGSTGAANGFPLVAGRNELVVPRTDVRQGPVVLRVVADSGSITVRIDRA